MHYVPPRGPNRNDGQHSIFLLKITELAANLWIPTCLINYITDSCKIMYHIKNLGHQVIISELLI